MIQPELDLGAGGGPHTTGRQVALTLLRKLDTLESTPHSIQDLLMRRCIPFLASAAMLLLTQCAEHDPVRRFASGQVSTSTSDATTAAELISRYRVAHGLRIDPRLSEAAKAQARAVAEAGTLSHGRFASRMVAFGIGASAENLSAGSRSADRVIARWTASPSHNDNLLMPRARRIGLARADSPGLGYGRYWALVLAE
jgi:uncharacterized protein YkwD